MTVTQTSSLAPTDAELLRAFWTRRDQEAMAVLVRRHAPMVMGVCRTFLRHEADAEDAAQAVFLVLAQKSESLTTHPNLAGWLHRVAWHISTRLRRDRQLHRQHEQEQARMKSETTIPDDPPADAAQIHTALAGLSEKYRLALVLHHLEGYSQEQIAKQLAVPLGTIAARLSRGRELLRRQLVGSGATLAVGILPLAQTNLPSLSANFVHNTVQMASQVTFGGALATTGTPAIALAKGTLHMMLMTQIKVAAVTAALVLTTVSGITYVAWAGGPPGQSSRPPVDRGSLTAPQAPAGVTEANLKDWADIPALTLTPTEPQVVTGVIVDQQQKPVPRAVLNVIVSVGQSMLNQQIATDAEGRYRLEVHPAVRVRLYSLRTSQALWVQHIAPRQPDANYAIQSARILKSPFTKPVEVQITMAPATSYLAGRICDAQGQPVAGAKVHFQLVPPSNEPLNVSGMARFAGLNEDRAFDTVARLTPLVGAAEAQTLVTQESPLVTHTDATGKYQLPVAPGRYTLDDVRGPAGSNLGLGGNWKLYPAQYAVGDGATTSVDLTVVPTPEAPHSTLVKPPALPPRQAPPRLPLYIQALTATGAGVGALECKVIPSEALHNPRAGMAEVTTPASGRFWIKEVSAQGATLYLASGTSPYTFSGQIYGSESTPTAPQAQRRTLSVFGDRTNLNIHIPASYMAQPLQVLVTEAQKVTLQIKPPSVTDPMDMLVRVSTLLKYADKLSNSGSYGQMLHLRPGQTDPITIPVAVPTQQYRADGTAHKLEEFQLWIYASPGSPQPNIGAKTIPLDQPNQTLAVALDNGQIITGNVVDSAGQPVAGAVVSLLVQVPGDPKKSAQRVYQSNFTDITGVKGTFCLPQVPAGKYQVEVRTTDARNLSVSQRPTIEVKANAVPAPLALTLAPAVRVTGQILGADGKPTTGRVAISHTDFVAQRQDLIIRHATASLPYEIIGLIPGTYTVMGYAVTANGGATKLEGKVELEITAAQLQAGKPIQLDISTHKPTEIIEP